MGNLLFAIIQFSRDSREEKRKERDMVLDLLQGSVLIMLNTELSMSIKTMYRINHVQVLK